MSLSPDSPGDMRNDERNLRRLRDKAMTRGKIGAGRGIRATPRLSLCNNRDSSLAQTPRKIKGQHP
jgi:hypothetical protein